MEIGNSLQIFESYKNYISEDETLGLALFETHEELLKFAVATIKILKFVRAGQYNEYSKCHHQWMVDLGILLRLSYRRSRQVYRDLQD